MISSLCIEANGGGVEPPNPANAAKDPKFYAITSTVYERDDEGYPFIIAEARSHDFAEQIAAAMNLAFHVSKTAADGSESKGEA